MSRAIQPLCLLCQHKFLTRRFAPTHVRPWQSSRTMAQKQRRRSPSRMTLSPKVASPVKPTTTSENSTREDRNSPFGGMNMKSAQITRAPNRRSAAEIKRSSGGREIPQKEERDNQDTFKALKMQRALTPVSYKKRASVKESISEIESFDQFELLPVIKGSIAKQALTGLDYITPTPIQRLAIPTLLGQSLGRRQRSPQVEKEGMEQFLIAAETGSGKTLAYLLPVLDAIKKAEVVDAEVEAVEQAEKEEKRKTNNYYVEPPPLSDRPHPTTGRPRAIILLPTSELVTQVGTLAKALSPHHQVPLLSTFVSLHRSRHSKPSVRPNRHRSPDLNAPSTLQHRRIRPQHPVPRHASRHRRSRLPSRPLLRSHNLRNRRQSNAVPAAADSLLRDHPPLPGHLSQQTFPSHAPARHSEPPRHPSPRSASRRRHREGPIPRQQTPRLCRDHLVHRQISCRA